jgi:copper(I)-binding protein
MLLRGRPASASGMTLMPSPANPTEASRGRRWPQGRARGRRPAAFRRICAIAVAAAIPALAGCEAGLNAPVLQWHQPVNGVNKTLSAVGSGFLGIRDLFVLGPVPGGSIPAGSSAGAFLGLVNTGPRDRLLSITAPGTATSVTLPGGSVVVPDGKLVLLTGPVPSVVLHGLTHSLIGGTDVTMVLHFQNAGIVTLQVPVLAKANYYATYSPAPSPSPTPTGKHKHRGGAGSTASPSPTATPSPSATPTPTATP